MSKIPMMTMISGVWREVAVMAAVPVETRGLVGEI